MAPPPVYTLKVGDEEIDVQRKRIKHLYLGVDRTDGRVKVSAPLRVSDAALATFVLSKQSWISKQRASLRALQTNPACKELQYASGEHHWYCGDRYLMNVVHDKSSPRVAIRDSQYLDVFIHPHASREQRCKLVTEWYRHALKQLVPPLIAKWQPVMDVEVKEWRIKQMKTRWGTCNISARRIWLNLDLVKKPAVCLEYVVVHEMVHLLESSHNARFKAYMDRFIPGWREHKRLLNHF
ncbi:M48 family metallopeptidase [Kaarinaea lacus]